MKWNESLKQRWIVWVWTHTPNCAEMSRLTSQSFETALPVSTRLKMRLHSLICVWCKRYRNQLNFLRGAALRLDEHADQPTDRGLSAEAKQRMLRRLQAK